MKTLGEYIKAKRDEMGLSAKELAKGAGISDVHVIYIEKGKRRPTFDVVMRILRALNADVQEFLQETGYLPANIELAGFKKLRPVPVISYVMAGRWHEVSDAFQPGDAEEWTESDASGEHVFALRVRGDSMEPEFREGDIVIVNPHVEAKPGDYVIVKNDAFEVTFKQLKRYGDTLVLHPLNPKYPDIELSRGHKYQIIGKVVEKKKRY